MESKEALLLMRDLAVTYREEGKLAQAETMLQEVVDVEKRTLGPEHLSTPSAIGDLAFLYPREGKYSQAEALCGQSLAVLQRVLGPEHPRPSTPRSHTRPLSPCSYLRGTFCSS